MERQERYEESGECGGVGSSRHGCGGASGLRLGWWRESCALRSVSAIGDESDSLYGKPFSLEKGKRRGRREKELQG